MRSGRTPIRLGSPPHSFNRLKTSPQPASPSPQMQQKPPDHNPDPVDVQTKLAIVLVSIFTLIFVLVLLVIGHFTWFADIRKELQEEWLEELKKEEERRAAKTIINEMTNPFVNLEDDAIHVDEEGMQRRCENAAEIRRRESIDSYGCTRGLCVPPHHSILCPNNPSIPSLNEPFPLPSPSSFYPSEDPIEYRHVSRRPSEWMNLESCVKISEPIPLRNRMMSFSTIISSPTRRPMTPLTPDPAICSIISNEGTGERDIEAGKFTESLDLKSSPVIKFDLSKLDLI